MFGLYKLLLAGCVVFLLSGCHDDKMTDAPPLEEPGTPEEPMVSSDLQTEVLPPDYSASIQSVYKTEWFNRINDYRASLGLGLLAQSKALDTATYNHHKYIFFVDESYLNAMDEAMSAYPSIFTLKRQFENADAGSVWFRGVTPQDRCDAAGYWGACPDSGQWGWDTDDLDRYSALLLLTQGAREIGMSDSDLIFMTKVNPYLQLGYPAGISPQHQASGFVLAAAVGDAFHVHVNEGEKLEVESFRVWNDAGIELAGTVMVQDNDPLGRMPSHAAMFVSDRIVNNCGDSSYYKIVFSGRRNGKPLEIERQVVMWGLGGYCD